MEVVTRADGGPSIGYGHLVRTGALAERFIDAGHAVALATTTPKAAAEVWPARSTVLELDAADSHADLLERLAEREPEVAVVDSYGVDATELRAVRDRVQLLVAVDDLADRRLCADVVLNGNVYAPELDYEVQGSEPVWCLGTDYLLIRRAIRSLVGREVPFRDPPERALITMGGSDIRNATPGVVRAFDGLPLMVEVVVGPGFDDVQEIRRAAAETDAVVDVVLTPEDLPERMLETDFAVSATGSTVYELLALRTPTVGIPQADNQVPIAEELERREAIVTTTEAHGLPDALDALVEDAERRWALRERGSSIVDGRGVDRVYDILTDLVA